MYRELHVLFLFAFFRDYFLQLWFYILMRKETVLMFLKYA
jgi:hypothetical protein